MTIPYLSGTDRVAAQRGRTQQVAATLDRFIALCDFLTGDYAKHDERQTMGGIIKISSEYDYVCGEHFSPSEVQAWVRLGLLARDGKWIGITDTGHNTYAGHTLQEAA